jgi:hypothetical protein
MKTLDPNTYSPEQLRDMLAKMEAVTAAFYPAAASTGVHTFIEFTGLMHEFIKICRQSAAQDVDFASASTHTGKPLVVYSYNADYIVEKLDCIFGPAIKSSPEVRAAFAKLLGDPEQDRLEQEALELPLLFHSGGAWDEDKRTRWKAITGSDEATTKAMCDHIRKTLGRDS